MRYVLGVAALLSLGCDSSGYRLVDHVEEAEKLVAQGRYAEFVEDTSDGGLVDVAGDARRALTPPFPASLRFELELPESAFLSLAPALITRQRVGRARVEYVVTIETADGERTAVLTELLRHTDANQWRPRDLDLTPWAGEPITLELTTRESEGRADMLWANRVQAVWGEPIIEARPDKHIAASLDELLGSSSAALSEHSEAWGVGSSDVSGVWQFAGNILLGGLLSIAIREVYLRVSGLASGANAFANLFPLFTITTIVVIAVVRSSLALSLGLLGALSVVRFRSAIKSPEELAYLLFCASVGVALGAEQRALAITSVAIVCAFVAGRHLVHRRRARDLLLTVSGDATRFYGDERSVFERVCEIVDDLEMQRIDHHGSDVELRAIVTVDADEATSFIARLRETLPGLQFSCSDADDAV